MPDSSSMHTFAPSVTLQRCCFGSVGTVVDGGTAAVVAVVGDLVVDFVLVAVFTFTMMLDALFNALECSNENSEPLSPLIDAMTINNKTQTIGDSKR